MSDAVNNPDHYNQGSIECIEAMKIVLTPEEFRGYLKGNVFKYLWREKDKNGNEDIRKGKSYYDWLIELIDESEQQKASDLQSHKEHPFGESEQPAWTPKIGDWVRIKKTENAFGWIEGMMDEHDGKVVLVSEIEDRSIVHEGWYFSFDWLEPAEQPKATLNSDKIPEGYRKLGDSVAEPRQPGDLRWSIAEKRYIEISVDEIGYANRDNWAACRKVESAIKQSLTAEPPDGWRWLEVGEVIRKGDRYFKDHEWIGYDLWVGGKISESDRPSVRRNRFEVGEKVVDCRSGVVFTVQHFDKEHLIVFVDGVSKGIESKLLAPYIEETK